jgi:hypothetical protein
MNLGSYQEGRFYSIAFSGRPRISDEWVKAAGMASAPGWTGDDDFQRTFRTITLLHETSHYLHDLSLGTSLRSDLLLDESAHWLFDAMRESDAPIPCPVTREFCSSEPASLRQALESFAASRSQLPNDDECRVLEASRRISEERDRLPSIAELEEASVAVTTAMACCTLCGDSKDLGYLGSETVRSLLLGEGLSKVYFYARAIFDSTLGKLFGIADYQNDNWPWDYFDGSTRRLGDLKFLSLVDVALHVPPTWYSDGLIKSGGRLTTLDFNPSHRYVQAIKAVARQGGFPEAAIGFGFHRTIFNAICNDPQLQWPNYDDTNAAWMLMLDDAKKSGSISSGFKYRSVVEKNRQADAWLTQNPVKSCFDLYVPLFQLTPTGFDWIVPMGKAEQKHVFMEFPAKCLPAYMLLDVAAMEKPFGLESSKWINPISLEEHMTNVWSFLREIVARCVCRALQDAVFQKSYFACPFADAGCDVAQPACKALTSVSQTPVHGCAIRRYFERLNLRPNALSWRQ